MPTREGAQLDLIVIGKRNSDEMYKLWNQNSLTDCFAGFALAVRQPVASRG
jgi:hypothetical protein